MTPPLSRLSFIAVAGSLLVMWPFMESCAHSSHSSALRGGAPVLLDEDAPRAHGGTNPNAPYEMAASSPQLVKRSEASDSAAAAPCDSKYLEVTEIAAAVNGNYRAVKIAFENEGLAPCRMGGYPSVALLDSSGTPVANLVVDRETASSIHARLAEGPMQATSKTDAQITIPAKGEAWFQVGWTTGANCPVVSRISVTAPGATESFTVNHPLTVCNGHVQITTLQSDQDSD